MPTDYFLIYVSEREDEQYYPDLDPSPESYPRVVIKTDKTTNPAEDAVKKYKGLLCEDPLGDDLLCEDPDDLLGTPEHPLQLKVIPLNEVIGQVILLKQQQRFRLHQLQVTIEGELDNLYASIISDTHNARKIVPDLSGASEIE